MYNQRLTSYRTFLLFDVVFMSLNENTKIDIKGQAQDHPKSSPNRVKSVVALDNEEGMFVLHSVAQVRCVLVALNQLNKISDNPFDT